MYCKKCGQQIPDNAVFCENCGAEQRPGTPAQNTPEPVRTEKPIKQRKKLSGKAKAIISLCVIFAIIIGIAVAGLSIYLNSPARDVMDRLAKGEYDKALNIYQRDVSDSTIHNALLKNMLGDELSDKLKTYADGTLRYDEALPYLSAIIGMDVIDEAKTQLAEAVTNRCSAILSAYSDGTLSIEAAKEELSFTQRYESLMGITAATEQYNRIIALNASRENFESGESYYASGDYEDALEYYGRVSEDSAYYEQAQSMIASAIQQYRAEVLESARGRVDNGDYVGAISVLEMALEVIANDEEITRTIDAYSSEYFSNVKNDALARSTNLSADGDFVRAMEILKGALDIIGEDSEIQRAYSSCVNSYVEHVTREVNAMIDEDWDAAHELIVEALNILPDNEQLIALNQEVMDVQPIDLNTLVVVDSRDLHFADEFDGVSDSYGNTYYDETPYLFRDSLWGDYEEYVIYNLSQNYTYFSCTIAPHSEYGSDQNSHLVIFLDDKKVFEQAVNRTTTPFMVELDVTNATLLKIYLVYVSGSHFGYSGPAGIIIADGIVKK